MNCVAARILVLPTTKAARQIILFSVLLVLGVVPTQNAKANTTPGVGVVCLEDPGTPVLSGTSCNFGPGTFTGPAPNASQVSPTQIRIGVSIENSSSLDGFDIILLADHTFLRPAGIDLVGSILGQNLKILVECIGGKSPPPILYQCSPQDTADTIELSASSQALTAAPTTGLLFTAIYDIVNTTTSSGVTTGFQTGCTNSSISGGTCVFITNGSTTPVPETIQTGNFSDASTPPWVSVSLTASQPGPVLPGKVANFTLTYTPQNGWPGPSGCAFDSLCQVYLSWVTSSSAIQVCCFQPLTFTLNASKPVSITLGLAASAVPPSTGTFFATIYGEYDTSVVTSTGFPIGTLVAPITLTLDVFDYALQVQPSGPITFRLGQSGSRVLTVTSLNGFTGNVAVSTRAMSPVSGLTVTYNGASSTTVSVPAGGGVNITMGFSSTTAAQYLVQPKGVFGSYTKVMLPATVVVQDFRLSSNNVTFAPGALGSATVTLSGLPTGNANGYSGSVVVTATSSSPNLSASCLGPVSVPAGGTSSTTCGFNSSATGVYRATINAASLDGLLTHSTSIIVVVTQTQMFTTSFNGVSFSVASSLVNDTGVGTVTGFVQVQGTNSTSGMVIFSHSYFVNVTFPGTGQIVPAGGTVRFDLSVASLGDGILCSTTSASAPTISCFATYNPDVFNMGVVNLQDASALALAFGSTPGSPHWNPRYDFDLDGLIGLADVSIVFAQYGAPIIT